MNLKFSGVLVLAATQLTFASIIPVGQVPSTGNGLGAVNTILTAQSPGNSTVESGCVGAGVGGVRITGAAACPGNGPSGGNAFTGADTSTGASQSAVYSAASLGLTTFANLQLIFNGNEPQNQTDAGVVINNLAVTLWDPATGGILGAFYLASPPYAIADVFPGIGNAGYGFQLDAFQTGQANTILAAFPNLYIGAAMNVSAATGGPDTLQIRTISGTGGGGGGGGGGQIPEPATMALMGAGLAAVGLLKRKMS